MVHISKARSANQELLTDRPLVVVFVGGTSGIGEYTLRTLCRIRSRTAQTGDLRVYLIGRNSTAAEKILKDCRELCPRGVFEFVKADNLALLEDVDKCCEEIKRFEGSRNGARIDMLVMSQAVLQFGARQDTREGLDTSMSLLYYSRMRFITNLLPLLRTSSLPSGARCISIYAGGFEKTMHFYPDDFSLRQPNHFTFAQVRSQVTYMKTLFFERLAAENKGRLSCVHIYPGLVITPGISSKNNPWWFKLAWFFVAPFAKLYATSADDIAERVLYLATDRYPASMNGSDERRQASVALGTDAKLGSGAYSVKADGETNDLTKAYAGLDREDMRRRVWAHTNGVFEEMRRA